MKRNLSSRIPRKPGLSTAARAALLAALAAACTTRAANYVWTNSVSGNASGSWTNASSWNPNLPAAGTGNADTADFSTLDLTTDSTVWLDSNQTINKLVFADTATDTAANWLLNPGAINLGAVTLTLSGTAPTVTVNTFGTGKSAILNAILAGNTTWTKAGPGTLTLGGINSFSAGFTNAAGQINLANANAMGTGTITFSGGALDNTAGAILAPGNAQVWSSDLTFQGSANLSLGGAITLNAARTLTVNGSMLSLGGVLSGNYKLTKNGPGILRLTGNSTFNGGTVVAGGTLTFSGENASGGSSLGSVPTTPTPGNLVLNGGTLALVGGNTTLNVNRGIALGPTSGNGGGTLDVMVGSTLTVNSTLANNGGTGSLTKSGVGTLKLGAANSFSGGTTVNQGNLTLDFTQTTAPANNILNPAGSLTLGGGTLQLTNNAGTPNSQAVAGLSVTSGANTINLAPGSAGTATLAVNALSRTGGTVDFTGAGTSTTTTPNNPAGIFGGWATYKVADWAANDGAGNIAPCANYIPMPASGGSVTDNDLLDGSVGILSGALVANSIKVASGTVLELAGNSLTLNGTAGGWLTPSGSCTVSDSVGGGFLGAGPANELIVQGAGNLTLSAPLVGNGTPGSLTKSGSGTLTLQASNSYTGFTTVNGGTLVIGANGSLSANSPVKVNTGGTLSINAGGVVAGNVEAAPSTGSGTANVVNNGTIAGTLTLDAGEVMASPSANVINQTATGRATLNDNSSTGPVADNGFLVINGGTGPTTVGTISSTNGLGGIQYNSTYLNTLTLANGSTFGFFVGGANSQATLQATDNGSIGLNYFGYNGPNGSVVNFNGGTWNLGYIGQNNTGAQFGGTANLTNAAVRVLNNLNFSHGTWNVFSGSLFFAGAVSQVNGSSVNGLNLSVSNDGSGSGTLTVAGALTLGQQGANNSDTSSLTVGTGGTANIRGNLSVGTGSAQMAENNAVNLSGGKLLVNGTIAAGAGTGQTEGFYWTGGQLSATAITPSAGFTGPGSSITANSLSNSAGVLAPGDLGIAGKTTINGAYYQVGPGALAVDIGGTSPANAFQLTAANYYDFVSVSGSASLAGGLTANLLNGFTPTPSSSFTILSAASIVGTSTSLGFGGFVPVSSNGIALPGKYFQAMIVGTNLLLTNYGVALPALAARFTPTNSVGVPPLLVNFKDISSGPITNRHWNFGDGTSLDTLSTSVSHTYNDLGSYSVTLTVSAFDGSTSTLTGSVRVAPPGPNLTWSGAQSALWDLATANWLNGSSAAAFQDNSSVTFDDNSSVTNVTMTIAAAANGVTFNNWSHDYSLRGPGYISDGQGITLNGSSSVTLLTTNDYVGPTTINAGTLQVGNGTVSGAIDNTSAITDYGTLIFNQPDDHIINAPLSGNGSLTKAGAGTLTLNGANTAFYGNVTVNGGVLQANDSSGFGSGASLTLGNGGIARYTAGPAYFSYTVVLTAGGGGIDHSLPISLTTLTGTGPFIKGGGGTMTLQQDCSYTGGTIVNGGTLEIGYGSSSGSVPGSIALNGGSLSYNRADALVQGGTISGFATNSSIANSTYGNALTVTLADGINTFGSIRNGAANTMVLNASPNSTNYLSGTDGSLGVVSSDSASSLLVNGGTYFVSKQILFGYLQGGYSYGTLSLNGGTVVANYVNGDQGGASFTRCNLSVNNNATLHVTSGGLGINVIGSRAGVQSFTMTGGQVLLDDTDSPGGFRGMRLGSYNGLAAADAYSGNVAVTQTGGAVTLAASVNNNVLLGNSAANRTATYLLSGGSLTLQNGGNLGLGAANDGTSSASFTLTNAGKLSVSGGISGYWPAPAIQVFAFQGGTLVASNVDMTNLRDDPANPAGTLVNAGGMLAPGDTNRPGQTVITGNYSCGSSAALAIDLNGLTPANAFANAGAYYDNVSVSGTASLNGSLLVSLNGLSPAPTDSFTILRASSVTGSFNNLATGSRVPLANVPAASFQVVNTGTSVVLTNFQGPAVVTPSRTNITYAASGGSLVLSWPNGAGWVLEAQTNSLGVGLGTNWVRLPGVTSPVTNAINPANGAVFYRLVAP